MPSALAGPRAPDPDAPPPRASASGLNAVASNAAIPRLASPAKTATAATSPDAGLLRLCAMFQDVHARCFAAPDDGNQWKVWLDRRWEITASIEDMAPHSEAGRLAKARVAFVLMEEAADTSSEYERFVLATLRDLAGSTGA